MPKFTFKASCILSAKSNPQDCSQLNPLYINYLRPVPECRTCAIASAVWAEKTPGCCVYFRKSCAVATISALRLQRFSSRFRITTPSQRRWLGKIDDLKFCPGAEKWRPKQNNRVFSSFRPSKKWPRKTGDDDDDRGDDAISKARWDHPLLQHGKQP